MRSGRLVQGPDFHFFKFSSDFKSEVHVQLLMLLHHACFKIPFSDEIVPGISVGIGTMRKGELARFLLTPYYGFRELGCPPRVPPNVPGWHNLKMPNVQFFFLLFNV